MTMTDLSISFHMGGCDTDLIQRAAELGYNDVTFQTEGGSNHHLLSELHTRATAAGIPGQLHDLGMTATAWVHEFDDKRSGLGVLALDNEALWADLAARYRRIFTATCPWLDRLVLTVSETAINCTDSGMLEQTVSVIDQICREHDKQLLLRSFVHDPAELEQVRTALERLPPSVAVITKMVPQDWIMTDQMDPLVGQVGSRPQIIELDICGEYWRGDLIPHFKGEWLASHFQHWLAAGCVGLSVRVDRKQRPGAWWQPQTRDYALHGQPQEADLEALSRLARNEPDAVTTAALNWSRQHCTDERAACGLAALLPLTGRALQVATSLRGYPFSITWNRVPGEWSMNKMHGAKAESRARPYDDDDDDEHRSPWHVKPSPMRWDPDRWAEYHQLRRGAEPFLEEKVSELDSIIADLHLARARLDSLKLTASARCFLSFMFDECLATTEAMGLCQCFWLAASRWLYAEGEQARTAAQTRALAIDARLAAISTRAGAMLDCSHAGRHWRQYGLQHLDIHGFRAWCRSYWYAIFHS